MRDGRAAPRITRRTAEQQPAGLRAAKVQVRGVLPGEAHAATWPAEIAVTIVDDWHGRGLGTELLTQLSGRARSEGIKPLHRAGHRGQHGYGRTIAENERQIPAALSCPGAGSAAPLYAGSAGEDSTFMGTFG